MEIFTKNNVIIEGNLASEKTIVFAHGFGTDQSAWRFIKNAFADDYRLVFYDSVGNGKAHPEAYSPLKYATLGAYVNDLVDIATALNLKDAILVAHSVSSMIGLLTSIRKPDLFSKLVIIGASPCYLNDEDYHGGFEQSDLDGLYNAMKVNYYAWVSGFSSLAMGNAEKPELGLEFARTLSAVQPDIALAVSKVIFQSDCRSELPKLRKDVLIIQAKDDIAVPAYVGEYLHANIAGSRLKNIDVSGHLPHISVPSKILEAIKAFI